MKSAATSADLGDYDYRPANEVALDKEGETAGLMVDVDILGHIFEQSITDLERLRNELDGQTEPAHTKRQSRAVRPKVPFTRLRSSPAISSSRHWAVS